jgi:hypothetical protein
MIPKSQLVLRVSALRSASDASLLWALSRLRSELWRRGKLLFDGDYQPTRFSAPIAPNPQASKPDG